MEKVTLDVHPSLIILHEPSRYFLKEDPIEVGQQRFAQVRCRRIGSNGDDLAWHRT